MELIPPILVDDYRWHWIHWIRKLQVSKGGEAPWIIAVQRQLVGGAVVTKEVLRMDDARRCTLGHVELVELGKLERKETVSKHVQERSVITFISLIMLLSCII